MPQPDDHDDLSALDFSSYQSGSDSNGHEDVDALDFSATRDDRDEESDAEALDAYAPTEPEHVENELEAISATTEAADEDEDEEGDGSGIFTVLNPPETVAVSAMMDGSTHRVRLSATATKLTEFELAEEIVVLAGLARKKGLAGQHTYLSDNASQIQGLDVLSEFGIDSNEMLREVMASGMQLPTPDQAEAEQAEVFAARYTPDK